MTAKTQATKQKTRCLVLSHGPVPAPEHPVVEGGGLRCWGLAKGIQANKRDIAVTVAYHKSHLKDTFTDEHDGIHITTWDNDSVAELIKGFDSVVVSYCMGDLSVLVARNIKPNQQLILDCYVPIYVEVSARESKDIEGEYQAFTSDVYRWAEVLKRGDVFLCASAEQKRYYQGVLSGLGRINPATYNQDNILITPYGIYREKAVAKEKPISKLIKDESYKKVLWFGGIYPWFDLRQLVDAVSQVNKHTPTKLVIVGAKNPYNTHPDFVARYQELVDYISSSKTLRDVVVMQDWVKFEDRADWYLDSDCVVVINKEGPENELAWRTRLVDFMWADLPILTNGGDPLGESLLKREAAFRFSGTDADSIAADIKKLLAGSNLKTLHKNLEAMRGEFYWDNVTKQVAHVIATHRQAADLETFGVFSSQVIGTNSSQGKVRRVANKARKVPAYANKYGYSATAKVVTELARRKLAAKSVLRERKKPAYVFVSHQLDMSGAPFIAIDMALEFKDNGKDVEFYTYLPAHKNNLTKLNKTGIKPHVLMNKDMVPSYTNGDTVILNTVAHSEVVKESVFGAAEQGILKQVIWYLHEDDPELIFRPDEQKRIRKMLKNKQLKILVPAEKILDNYCAYFETSDGIVKLAYRHIVPKKYHQIRSAADFTDKLTFVLPGTMGDGRKGQLPIFYAFVQFYNQYYKDNRKNYRDFELVYIGLSSDFLSRQVKAHADALKGHFKTHGRVTWEEDLDIVSKGNITICYSIREALPLFVFEGMISGHPILRNDSSGKAEQLIEGKNGWCLETNDFDQVVSVIEGVLNKGKTPDNKLANMSEASYEIAAAQAKNSYLRALED